MIAIRTGRLLLVRNVTPVCADNRSHAPCRSTTHRVFATTLSWGSPARGRQPPRWRRSCWTSRSVRCRRISSR
jgi:hypothetical protein